tara:strand:- start:139 stop:279 length:141 start_codon:yes stop_codon:yes gene_type:complete
MAVEGFDPVAEALEEEGEASSFVLFIEEGDGWSTSEMETSDFLLTL